VALAAVPIPAGESRLPERSRPIPAATVDLMDLAQGRMGPQRLGLERWSGTFDPVRLYRAADRAACRPAEPLSSHRTNT
jgi:hypothetical protein